MGVGGSEQVKGGLARDPAMDPGKEREKPKEGGNGEREAVEVHRDWREGWDDERSTRRHARSHAALGGFLVAGSARRTLAEAAGRRQENRATPCSRL
ncbi:hypothetical protein AXG93_2727s1340 [Marchantia polymorpha subsp. ruderalis]|uniref:Uncharacterized protein n=1 Tax=Marchantia polymorpha subsp. ruderalis TaxID=1480154 RepID=A0A176VBT2_MARPO|nr:hypothetical protein AXG93_2727s1340 [Marchantia polymorpha subsp. ruderalis]